MARQKQDKRFIAATFSAVLIYFILLLGHNLILDPWQLYHKPWFREKVFIKNGRLQNGGLINSYDFDSFILGTSMAENFSARQATHLWDSLFINLSISGGFHSERALILKRALDKKAIKQVIYSLDYYPDAGVNSFQKGYPVEQYDFLYNRNRLDDLSLYLDWNLFSCWEVENEVCRKLLPGKRSASREELYAWKSDPIFKRRFGGLDNWLQYRSDIQLKSAFRELEQAARRIEENALPRYSLKAKTTYQSNLEESFTIHVAQVAEGYPKTHFYLFFPPYSTLYLAMWLQSKPDIYGLYIHYIRFVVETCANYENVSVYGFNDMDFTDDIANYKDLRHYSALYNRKMLEWMRQGKHELTEDNVDAYLAAITDKAQKYDFMGLARIIRETTAVPKQVRP